MKLDQIMQALDLHVIQSRVDLRIDEAQRIFLGKLPRIKVKDEKEFLSIVASFYDFMRQHLYGANVPMPQPFLLQETRDFLNRANRNGGYVQLVRDALITGSIMSALNLLCEEFKRQATNEYFQGVVINYIPQLSYEERERITIQLLQKISPEFNYGQYDLPLIVQKLEEMVIQYASHLNSLRKSIGRI